MEPSKTRDSPQRSEPWARLLRQVLEANPDVQDAMDVAATIESTGYSDRRVAEVLGYPTVFDLAQEMYEHIVQTVRSKPLPVNTAVTLRQVLVKMLRDFLHGLTFMLPMAVSVVSMIVLHITLNSYQYFSVAQATALALATFLSFVATGGFTQAMANSYYLLLGLQEIGLVESTLYFLMRWGIYASMLMAGLLLIGDSFFPMLPTGVISFLALYMVLLSALWLAFASLYVLRREYLLTLITGLAGLLAYLLWRHGVPVIVAQITAIVASSLTSVALAVVIFRRSQRRWKETNRVVKTRTSQLAYATASYFVYGILYFVFIYIDRLVAWTTNTSFLPYSIWFRGQYELGMDWSLATLILPLGAAEALIGFLLGRINRTQQEVPERAVGVLSNLLWRNYVVILAVFFSLSLVSLLLSRLVVDLSAHLALMRGALPTEGVEPFVFSWSSTAYLFLALALFNVLLLFTLSYPAPALRSFVVACGADLALGLVATHVTNQYQYAVFGLMVGSLYLMVASTIEVLRVFRSIDFYVYRVS